MIASVEARRAMSEPEDSAMALPTRARNDTDGTIVIILQIVLATREIWEAASLQVEYYSPSLRFDL